ncbi:MAG: creatininase family protein [Rhodobacteraceae bacterium]|nr:creatininase family protein [Paracoccaceae bacterium]
MKLQLMTWPEVEAYLSRADTIILPVGSTEQHGPIGLIGTDAYCAEIIADEAAEICGAIVAPVLALTPAPFNMAFPGTISLSTGTFQSVMAEVLSGLIAHGFGHIYVLNAHGANLAPLTETTRDIEGASIRIRSWWDFGPVNALRQELYGSWEGMHATPSEVAITQARLRVLPMHSLAETPPRQLTDEFIRTHSGDRHGPPDAHRAAFPDGRVGSHSALAKPEHGTRLIAVAAAAVAADIKEFSHRN